MPASSLGSYLEFLKVLLSLGPKLQTLWPKIQALVTLLGDIAETVSGFLPGPAKPADDGVLQLTVATIDGQEITAEVLEAETQVAALIGGPTAAFDMSSLRILWQILQALPSLWEVFSKLK